MNFNKLLNKIFIGVITLLLQSNSVIAQYILLDVRPEDCISCRSSVKLFGNSANIIPCFALFSTLEIKDSSALRYSLGLNESIDLLFDDGLKEKYFKDEKLSSLLFFDENGNLKFKKYLKEVDAAFLKDSIYNYTSKLQFRKNVYIKFDPNNCYVFNNNIGTLDVYNKNNFEKEFAVESKDFDCKWLADAIKTKNIDFKNLLIKGNQKSNQKPLYTYFDIDDNGAIYLMLRYWDGAIIANGSKNDTAIYEDLCMVKFDRNGKYLHTKAINHGDNFETDNYAQSFILKDSLHFLAFTHDAQNWINQIVKNNPDSNVRFLTEFSRRKSGKTYQFEKFYDVPLPYMHRKILHDNYLEITVSNYPFVGFHYGNTIYNIASKNSAKLISDADYYLLVDSNKTKEPNNNFKVLNISTDKANKCYACYFYNNSICVNEYDFQLNLIRKINISKVVNPDDLEMVYVDPYKNVLYAQLKKSNSLLALPIALLEKLN